MIKKHLLGLVLGLFALLPFASAQQETPDNRGGSTTRDSSGNSSSSMSDQQNDANAQSGAEDEGTLRVQPELPAARIIAILRTEPQLLQELKQQLVTSDEQSDSASSSAPRTEMTDARLFQRIKRSQPLRITITRRLLDTGTVASDDPELYAEPPDQLNDQAEPSSGVQRNTTGTEAVSSDSQDRSTASRTGTGTRTRAKATPQQEKPADSPIMRRRKPPYANLPALRDLYTQTLDSDVQMERFGANLFRLPSESSGEMDMPAGLDYVIGPGDGLTVDFWGSVSRRLRVVVDREGRIPLPESGSIAVVGKTLREAQDAIERTLRTQYKTVNVDVSVSRIRSVRIYVVGDVAHPGAYNLSALSTALNALYAAGGATPRGSLRNVKHYRGEKLVGQVDLYDLLLHGVRGDVERMEPGDTILIPPVGPQVYISGMVRRPAIYELRSETTLAQALDLAGGVLVAGDLREIKVERTVAHEHRVMLSVQLPSSADAKAIEGVLNAFKMEDGDKVSIASITLYSNQAVYLDGHVIRPGKYPFRQGMTATDLIGSYASLLPEPAQNAELIRLKAPDMHPEVMEFDLPKVLSGETRIVLQPFDTVRINGRYQYDAPRVSIFGEVLRPGEYPMSEGMSAADLLRLAGGFSRSAYRDTVDLSSYSIVGGKKIASDHRLIEIQRALDGAQDTDVRLKPGDVLTIRQISGWDEIGSSVQVAGEVHHVGTYGIQTGERLSSVLRRADGFRESAYPAGVVLTRVQVRDYEVKARDALVRRIESATPTASSATGEAAAMSAAFVSQQQAIVKRLREQPVMGRLVIHITSDISKWENTPADIEMRPGDTLMVPKIPNFVAVSGQVNSPSAITYTPRKSAAWYLKRAGGPTEFANAKNAFIVRADGSVIGRSSSGLWSGSILSSAMRPGDTIVLPEKILSDNPVWRNLLNTAQITSSLAIAAKVATSF